MSDDNRPQVTDWREYWKRRKPGDKRPEPVPYCEAHGCEKKGTMKCKCGAYVCSDHAYGIEASCVVCKVDGDRDPATMNDTPLLDDDEPCPFCGEDADNCYCHDALFG